MKKISLTILFTILLVIGGVGIAFTWITTNEPTKNISKELESLNSTKVSKLQKELSEIKDSLKKIQEDSKKDPGTEGILASIESISKSIEALQGSASGIQTDLTSFQKETTTSGTQFFDWKPLSLAIYGLFLLGSFLFVAFVGSPLKTLSKQLLEGKLEFKSSVLKESSSVVESLREYFKNKMSLDIESDRIRSALENTSTNIMIANEKFEIVYMNKNIYEMFRVAEKDIQKQFSFFQTDKIMGMNIDSFHKDPAHQRNLLSRFTSTFKSEITIGGRSFELVANPILTSKGDRLGSVVEWNDSTEKRRVEKESQLAAQNSSAISKIMLETNKAKSVDAVVTAALNVIREVYGWNYASFWKIDSKTNVLKFETESGFINSEFASISKTSTFQEGVGVNGRAWKNRDVVFVEELSTVLDCVRAPYATKANIHSGIAFPIVVEDHVVGTIDFFTENVIKENRALIDSFKSINTILNNALTKLKQDSDMLRVKVALDNTTTNVMIADNDGIITYMNKTIFTMFRNAEKDIQKQFAHFATDKLIGTNFDVFHKVPSHQRNVLAALTGTHRTSINIG